MLSVWLSVKLVVYPWRGRCLMMGNSTRLMKEILTMTLICLLLELEAAAFALLDFPLILELRYMSFLKIKQVTVFFFFFVSAEIGTSLCYCFQSELSSCVAVIKNKYMDFVKSLDIILPKIFFTVFTF